MSKIEWTTETLNAVTGCDKVTKGCDNCYALVMSARLQGIKHSAKKYAGTVHRVGRKLAWTGKINLHPDILLEPLSIKKPTTFFVNSMSDTFHKDVPFDFVDRLMAVIALTPQHTYQVLTKRADRMEEYFSDFIPRMVTIKQLAIQMVKEYNAPQNGIYTLSPSLPLPNLWLGISVEDQKRFDDRINHLCNTPAAVRFLSCEPLQSYIKMFAKLDTCAKAFAEYIHWVIAGGESGHNAAPVHPDWLRSIRDQCQAAGVPFFFKQWGEYRPAVFPAEGLGAKGKKYVNRRTGVSRTAEFEPRFSEEEALMLRIGKKKSGCLLDGVEHKEFPKPIK